MSMKDQSLRVLIVEDLEDDLLLIIRELKKGGYNPVYERVETASAMKKTIEEKQWDIILCDYEMPNFNVPSAIAVLKEANIDLPIIIVSGAIGEETAIECMRLGARDYIMKSKLSRLCPTIARELEDAEAKNRQKQVKSQRESAIEEMRQSEEKYRTILETFQEAYFEVDLAGNFIFFNDPLCRITGYSKEELTGMNHKQFTDKETSEEVLQAFNKVYNTGEPLEEFDWQIIRKDGAKRYLEASASLQKNPSGKPTGIRGIIRDITKHKREAEKFQRTFENLQKAIDATLQVMVSAVEVRDPYTHGHQLRSANLACAIATEMGLAQDKKDGIRVAGSIYDIGKLSIPAQILTKPTKLTSVEVEMIKEHCWSGYEMLKNVESPWPLAQIVYQHHERMNGSGYPKNLKGDEILMEARVLAVSDVMESMAALRPYRPALGMEVALEEIKQNKGILYDNDVADTCLRLFREKS